MPSKLRSKLSYANVMATIAVFIALGGTSFAAAALITGKNVKNSSLTGVDIRNGGLTGADVRNQSLSRKDFKGSVAGAKGDIGPQGTQGTPGVAGAPAAIARTVIAVTGSRTRNVTSYAFFALGSFAKLAGDSRIQLTYATEMLGQQGCRLQLRVDGLNSNGLSGIDSNTVTTPGDARFSGSGESAAVVLASFSGLAAGSHDVSVAVAADSGAVTCTDNFTSIPREVIVEEVPPPPSP